MNAHDTSPAHSDPAARTAVDPVQWSRRRWAGTIAAVFIAQILVIQLLEQPVRIVPRHPAFGAHVYQVSEGQLAEVHDLRDPTLFALPHLAGFSGQAWMQPDFANHVMPAWDEPRRWLALDTSELGADFTRFVSSNTPSRRPPVRRPVERLTSLEVYVPSKILEPHSELKIEGALAGRQLVNAIDLPSWPHTEILTKTVVQLLVDEEGYVISVTPLAESGLPQADQFALNFSRAARFERLVTGSPRALNWGRLVFDWGTALTNGFTHPNPTPSQ